MNRYLPHIIATVLAAALVLPACSADDGSSPNNTADTAGADGAASDAGSSSSDSGAADSGSSGGATDTIAAGDTAGSSGGGPTRTVTTRVHNITGADIAGASVCLLDQPELPCATSDAKGNVELAGVPTKDVYLKVTAKGFLDYLVPAEASAKKTALPPVGMIAPGLQANVLKGAGITTKKDHGMLWISAMGHYLVVGQAQTTFKLGKSSGEGPIYGKGGIPNKAATTTDIFGSAVQANVPAGDHDIGASNPAVTCKPLSFAKSGDATQVRAKLLPNTITRAEFHCSAAKLPESPIKKATITSTGKPVFRVSALHAVSVPKKTNVMDAYLHNHIYNVQHSSEETPYADEWAHGLLTAGVKDRLVFNESELVVGRRLSLLVTLEAAKDAPIGKSAQSDMGPIIPWSAMPLNVQLELWNKTAKKSYLKFDALAVNASKSPGDRKGRSHIPLAFGLIFDDTDLPLKAGEYEWRLNTVSPDKASVTATLGFTVKK